MLKENSIRGISNIRIKVFSILVLFVLVSVIILIFFQYIDNIHNTDNTNTTNTTDNTNTTNNTFEQRILKDNNIDLGLQQKSKSKNIINTNERYYDNIKLNPYGCFKNLKSNFFEKIINPYNKNLQGDNYTSGLILSDNEKDKDIQKLIHIVIDNGFEAYGKRILKKYDSVKNGFREVSLKEIGTLAKLAGYNYVSVYKYGPDSGGTIYLTYSPPMVSDIHSNFGYDYTSDEYNSILTKPSYPIETLTPKISDLDTDNIRCGYPCTNNGVLDTFIDSSGNKRCYMCGSVGYPTINTSEIYSVYKIDVGEGLSGNHSNLIFFVFLIIVIIFITYVYKSNK